MVVHVDKVKHCTGVTPVSWLGRDDYIVVPPALEADALSTMFSDVDQNAPNSSDDEARGSVIKRPKRNAVVPARYSCRMYAVLITVSQNDHVHTRINTNDNHALFLCVNRKIKKATEFEVP